jgi:hypothetical protein
MAQHLPEDLEEKVKLFHEFVKARREEEDFEDKMIINIDVLRSCSRTNCRKERC